MQSPSVLLLVFKGPPADPDVVGGILRMDHESGRYWIITLSEAAVSRNRVLECLAVLVLDEARGILPYVLFPYNPPQATLLSDGRLRDWSGADLPRVRIALIRRLRYLLRHRFSDYVEKLHRGLAGTYESAEFRPLETDHPLYTPHGVQLTAGVVPSELLQMRF